MNYRKFVSAHPDYNDEINLNRSVHSQLLLKCRLRHAHSAARCVIYTADKTRLQTVSIHGRGRRQQYQPLPTSLRRLSTDRHDTASSSRRRRCKHNIILQPRWTILLQLSIVGWTKIQFNQSSETIIFLNTIRRPTITDNNEFIIHAHSDSAVAVIIYRSCGPMARPQRVQCQTHSYICYQFCRRLVGRPPHLNVQTSDENGSMNIDDR